MPSPQGHILGYSDDKMASPDTVDDGKPTAGGDEETKVTTDHNGDVKKVPLDEPEDKLFPFCKLLAYADGFDWFLMALGTLGSVVHGMAQPIGYYLLGKALDAFGNNINDDKATVDALFQVIHNRSPLDSISTDKTIAFVSVYSLS